MKSRGSNHTALLLLAGVVAVVAGIVYLGRSAGIAGTIAANVNTPGYKEFDVVMQGNRYNPSRLVVDLNDRVVVNITNLDPVSHGVELKEFGASIPGGHVLPGQTAVLDFVAARKGQADVATCGGPTPTDKTDDHGEELIVEVI